MNPLLDLLSGSDLRSDGLATEVANLVLENEILIDELLEGLDNPDMVIRGRTADALEKITRKRPELVLHQLTKLIRLSREENPMIVKMHLAMIFGHILACDVKVEKIYATLQYLLNEKSVFTRSWVIVSLCILARKFPHLKKEVIDIITPLKRDRSIAIRTRANKALIVLLEDDTAFPKGWIKSIHLQQI